MGHEWFSNILLPFRVVEQNGVWVDDIIPETSRSWSFTAEWDSHTDRVGDITWDYSAKDRLRQFYLETRIGRDEVREKLLLDAGCGNGLLTQALAKAGAKSIGVDLQRNLPGHLSNDAPQFVLTNFLNLPFKEECFDIVIANGSLHHTPSTKHAFFQIAKHIKPTGKFYVWLYKRPDGWKNKVLLFCLDLTRQIICRLPMKIQHQIVLWLSHFFFWLSRKRSGANTKRSFEQIRINIYDAFTPRYRHYHRPEEVAHWFHACGFDPPILTHWNNKYGFGMVAERNFPDKNSPGENFI